VREMTERSLSAVFAALVGEPRCAASGNFATPRTLLRVFDGSVAKYRLHRLLAQRDIPDRDGVTYETAFVGPAMRNHPRHETETTRYVAEPRLSDVATHSQHTAVVTEHGIARVFGHSQSEQARNIIEQAARPRARDGLLRVAREMQLL